MSEKLKIEGFAGIKGLSIDLRRINVFIGPQSTGKSVTAKLLYFFKSLITEMRTAAADNKKNAEIKELLLGSFNKYFPEEARGDRAFCLRYEFADQSVVLECPDGKTKRPSLSWSDKYEDLLKRYIEVMEESHRGSRFHVLADGPLVKSVDNSLTLDMLPLLSNQLFIPAGRSFFAVVQQNFFTMLSAGASLDQPSSLFFDPFLTAFGSFYERSKNIRSLAATKDEMREVNELVGEVLGAHCVSRGREDFLEFADGRLVDLAHVSSGQQEVLPLASILEILTYARPGAVSQTVYVEEPEAHLFPATQRLVVELLATVFNTDTENFQFVVTTHSPYILTALNNLLQAGRLGKELADDASALKKLHRIVPKTRHLMANDVSAYYFDGKTAKSILSRRDGLINADVIDSVSEDLAVQFDKILDIGG